MPITLLATEDAVSKQVNTAKVELGNIAELMEKPKLLMENPKPKKSRKSDFPDFRPSSEVKKQKESMIKSFELDEAIEDILGQISMFSEPLERAMTKDSRSKRLVLVRMALDRIKVLDDFNKKYSVRRLITLVAAED